jgi:hypothetical protein
VSVDPIDCDAGAEILGTAFDHSYEGEDVEDIERREHGEGGRYGTGVPICDAWPMNPSATRMLETERM